MRETVERVGRATPEGWAVGVKSVAGKSFRAVVLGSDEARYAEVYAAVMEALEEAPRKLDAIESLTDAMEITKSPRRFGQHFIDVLETCDCVIWGDGAWNLTDLGRAMLAELKSAKEA